MATFRWKGRTADGRTVDGELDTTSKEEVLCRLREQRIVVTSITELGNGSAEPPDPDRVHLPPSREPRRMRGLLIVLAFVGAAAAVSYFAPVTRYRCDRTAGSVDCTVTELLLGIYPLRTHMLADVASVDIDSNDERARLVFTDRRGRAIRPMSWNESSPTIDIRSELSSFVAGGAESQIARWDAPRVPLLISGILLLMASTMFAALVLSFFVRAPFAHARRAGGIHAVKRTRSGHRPR